MARIRTIKPELWTDPEFTECSPNARLLFIAMLNFASDFGVLPDKPRQIKMQCLPADAIEVEPLLDELLERQFVLRCLAPNGEKVLVIRTFTQHQKINRPTLGRWGDPAKWTDSTPDPEPQDEADSVNDHGDLSESSPPEGKGRDNSEGKGSPSSSESVAHLALVPPVDKPDDDDFEAAVKLIVDRRCEGRRMDDPRAYRAVVAKEVRELDGDWIRQMLASGTTPTIAASTVTLGAHMTEPIGGSVPWCGPDCPECDGTSFVESTPGGGYVKCPNRKAATA